ncbi:MAG: hypothetical protein MRY64_08030 [Hyphomonadaceae bacterium]|nr:hypothetical protein [Hyphomonadaceae bacterium]
MDVTYKRWVGLGLGAALATSTVLTACSPTESADTPEPSAEAPQAVPAPAAVAGEGEGGGPGEGEGGEGEGGVSIAAAAYDPIVYGSAIAITKAHVYAARDAFIEGESEAAAEMYAHPVSEVLADMAPIFEAQGVEDFNHLLIDTSGAIFEGENVQQISARTDDILTALDAAAAKAPDNGSTPAEIAAGVTADQIERATDMYRAAAETDRYEPYLDGYGFYQAAAAAFAAEETGIEASNPDAAMAIRAALDLLAAAYPSALRPETLDADQSALTVASSTVVLTTAD